MNLADHRTILPANAVMTNVKLSVKLWKGEVHNKYAEDNGSDTDEYWVTAT